MARIKLKPLETYKYRYDTTIKVRDINYGGHLGNDALLSLVHEARVRFLDSLGYSELDVEGRGIIMTDSAVVYKAQAFHGDVVAAQVSLGDWSRKGCDIFYRLAKKATGEELALAKTGIVFFDYQAGKVVDVPGRFRALVEGLSA